MDSLLGHPATRVVGDVRSAGIDVECGVARSVAARLEPVPGVGATDCDCGGHLAFAADRAAVERAVRSAHGDARP